MSRRLRQTSDDGLPQRLARKRPYRRTCGDIPLADGAVFAGRVEIADVSVQPVQGAETDGRQREQDTFDGAAVLPHGAILQAHVEYNPPADRRTRTQTTNNDQVVVVVVIVVVVVAEAIIIPWSQVGKRMGDNSVERRTYIQTAAAAL